VRRVNSSRAASLTNPFAAHSHPTIPHNVNTLMVVVSSVNVLLQIIAVVYSHRKAPDRIAIRCARRSAAAAL
jgi:hypothetical protein